MAKHVGADELVMATAWGYSPAVYTVFLGSLRRSKYAGDIKLIAPPNRTSAAALAVCAYWRAEVLQTFELMRRPSVGRFVSFHQLCSAGAYRWCLGMDFRDAFFQRDPFEEARRLSRAMQPRPPELILSTERRTIAADAFNSAMVQACAGRGRKGKEVRPQAEPGTRLRCCCVAAALLLRCCCWRLLRF